MIKYIYSYINNVSKGYNEERYWNNRKKYYTSKSRIKRILILFFLRKTEKDNACYIGLPEKKDIFNDTPIMLHGLKGVFISTHCKIGKNVTIMQNVTIGSGKDGESPIIGDNVFIGAGATIIGNVIIGDYVRIGANTTVTEDIPSHATVVSQHARILYNRNYESYNLLKEVKK